MLCIDIVDKEESQYQDKRDDIIRIKISEQRFTRRMLHFTSRLIIILLLSMLFIVVRFSLQFHSQPLDKKDELKNLGIPPVSCKWCVVNSRNAQVLIPFVALSCSALTICASICLLGNYSMEPNNVSWLKKTKIWCCCCFFISKTYKPKNKHNSKFTYDNISYLRIISSNLEWKNEKRVKDLTRQLKAERIDLAKDNRDTNYYFRCRLEKNIPDSLVSKFKQSRKGILIYIIIIIYNNIIIMNDLKYINIYLLVLNDLIYKNANHQLLILYLLRN